MLHVNQSAAVEGLQVRRVFIEVFHLLCTFAITVKNAAGVATESP